MSIAKPIITFPSSPAERLVTELKMIKKEIEKLETQEKAKEDRLKAFFNDQEELRNSDGHLLATYKSVVRKSFDSTAFKVQNEALYTQFLKTVESKRLLIK